MKRVLFGLGTRPEIIKLAPVVEALGACIGDDRVTTVFSGQHADLVRPVADLFGIRIDHDLEVMESGQTLNGLAARVFHRVDRVLAQALPALVVVQGDTTTAAVTAWAAFHRKIPVAHVEAGLRSGDRWSPFPEEANRRLISQLATYHFAATERNREWLTREGIAKRAVWVVGNPVVDALERIRKIPVRDTELARVLKRTGGLRRLVVTMHRRENLGEPMRRNWLALRAFLEEHRDVAIICPVHPNPAVGRVAERILGGQPRSFLLKPLAYPDFIALLSNAWLVASDSGGVQEEVASLGKPLLVLRETTERPEAIEAGYALLVGHDRKRLRELLELAYLGRGWVRSSEKIVNPFGDGKSGRRVAAKIVSILSNENRFP